MDANLFQLFPGVVDAELMYVKTVLDTLPAKAHPLFASTYMAKRKDEQTILLLSAAGLVLVAGLQRFVLGQVGMGVAYLLTAGFCYIGTIIDIINYKKMTAEYNQQMAQEALATVRMLNIQ